MFLSLAAFAVRLMNNINDQVSRSKICFKALWFNTKNILCKHFNMKLIIDYQ